MNTSAIHLESASLDLGIRARVFALALLVVVAAELIGSYNIKAGPGTIILLLLWAMLIGCAVSLAKGYLPGPLKMEAGAQFYASGVLQSPLLLFIVKLALLVGASLPKILSSGYALIFQEFGHFFGTMIF